VIPILSAAAISRSSVAEVVKSSMLNISGLHSFWVKNLKVYKIGFVPDFSLFEVWFSCFFKRIYSIFSGRANNSDTILCSTICLQHELKGEQRLQ
jgi:hypothetical protein